jgi:hypothetical protein
MTEPNVLTVINPVEGKRYRVSLRGDINRLSVRKLKRLLAPSVQIVPEEQQLKYGGIDLSDEVLCSEVGIAHGSTVTVERTGAQHNSSLFSPRKDALEVETLEQQRAMLQQERIVRDDEFRRQQEMLARSIAQAEAKKSELLREKQDRELELQRLQEMEQLAEQERRRLADVRRQEADREALRARDLEARKEQLGRERAMQRQLEITKLENERKKMLLAQQRSELEAERARLDREVRDRIQRQREAEMRIREREVELERIAIDGERAKREIEVERAVLRQTRDAEVALMNAEREAEARRINALQFQAQQTARDIIFGSYGGSAAALDDNDNTHDQQRESPRSSPTLRNMKSTNPNNNNNNSIVNSQPRNNNNTGNRSDSAMRKIESRLMEIERQSKQNPSSIPRGQSPQRGGDGLYNGVVVGDQNQNTNLTQPQLRRIAQANLDVLAEHLSVGELLLDDNHTCVVSVDDKYTLLITVDFSTQRLYLYSTLATHVPKNADTKLRLYEFLLEGALLGRDMCGGGVGLSLKNDFVLMSTSIFLPLAAPTALRAITPKFVEALVTWRQRVQDIMKDGGEEVMSHTNSMTSNSNNNNNNVKQQQQHQRNQSAGSATSNTSFRSGGGGGERPVVGIEVTEQLLDSSTSTSSRAGSINQPRGVLVVASKGPAARGGVIPGDLICAVNGLTTPDLDEFQRAIQSLRPNSSASFVVNRLGADLQLLILVGSAPM